MKNLFLGMALLSSFPLLAQTASFKVPVINAAGDEVEATISARVKSHSKDSDGSFIHFNNLQVSIPGDGPYGKAKKYYVDGQGDLSNYFCELVDHPYVNYRILNTISTPTDRPVSVKANGNKLSVHKPSLINRTTTIYIVKDLICTDNEKYIY